MIHFQLWRKLKSFFKKKRATEVGVLWKKKQVKRLKETQVKITTDEFNPTPESLNAIEFYSPLNE